MVWTRWVYLAGTRIPFAGGVEVDETNTIVSGPPFVHRFFGQPLRNLEAWLGTKAQGLKGESKWETEP